MTTPKITIFYSYADKDKRLREELEKRLSVPRANITIENRHRDQITAGSTPADVVEQYIEQADIILLLLSPDFLAPGSLGHFDNPEVKHIMKLYFAKSANSSLNANKAPCIMLIHVRPTNWDRKLFLGSQVIPRNGKAVTMWGPRDSAWQEVMFDIDSTIEKFTQPSGDTQTGSLGTPQPTKSKMPPQNPFFTGREALLHKLRDELMRQKTNPLLTHKQVIYGLGGIGKTQLAVKYVYRYRTDYTHVFWVNAATRDFLIEEYIEIAHRLLLPEKDAKEQMSIVNAVMRWLETNTDWLLVLDNADRLAVVQDFIPDEINGHLLLTTRAKPVGEIAEALEIGSMMVQEGTLFLLLRAKKVQLGGSLADARKEDRENAGKIVGELGCLPLALDQAGAYMEEAGVGLGRYLELYQHQGVKILEERGELPRSHPDPVTTTFLLTFTEVKSSQPIAADVLRLCAFLAPDAIPEKLLTKYLSTTDFSPQNQKASKNRLSRQKPHMPTLGDIQIILNEASRALLRYSLIHRDDQTETVAVHRLVQAVLRADMDEDIQRQWAERAIRIVGGVFPLVEIGNMGAAIWSECQELLPHVFRCAFFMKKYQFSFPEASRFLNDAATYLTERGQYRRAEALYQQALLIRQAKRGLPYAQSLHNQGRVYTRLAEYENAEHHLQEALIIQEQVLGENHPDVAPTLNSLAALYKIRGKPKKAERFYERAFKISQRTDPEQFYLSHYFSDLIAFYRSQKNDKKTRELYKEALEKIEQKWGEEHPYTAKILHDWGEFSKEQGELVEAAELLQRALEIREKELGLEHADTASTLHSIAEVYEREGKAEEAEKLYTQALSIRKNVLGADNPETAASLYSLARLYRAQDKIAEAEGLYRQALSIRTKKFGPDHPSTLESQRELADFCKSQGRLSEARDLYKRGLASGYLILRPDNPAVVQNLRELVEIYTLLEKHEEVEQLYEEALTQRANRLGINHSSTEQCIQDLLKLYNDHGENEKVVRLYQRTFELRARKLRGDDQDSLQKFERNLKELASLYERLKRFKEKMHLYMKALEICGSVLGVGDPLERYCYNQLMDISEDQTLGKDIEDHYKDRLVARSLLLTAEVSNIVYDHQRQAKQDLAKFYEKQRRFEEVEKIQKQGRADAYKTFGFKHPASVQSRHDLAHFYEEHGKLREAERVYEEGVERCRKYLEPQNAHFLECRNDLVSFYLRHAMYEPAKPHIKELLQFVEPLLEEQPISKDYTLAVVRTLVNAAWLNQDRFKRKWRTTESWFERALQLSREDLGKDHPETLDISDRYIRFLREMGRDAEADVIEIDTAAMKEAEESEKNKKAAEKSEEPLIVDDDIELDEEDI